MPASPRKVLGEILKNISKFSQRGLMNHPPAIYEFGVFQLDAADGLLRDGLPLPLTPRALDVLLCLVRHAGHVVTKEQLLHEVWADTAVEDGSLTQTVWMVRKTLGGTVEHRLIETVPKRGYRFVAAVTERSTRAPTIATVDADLVGPIQPAASAIQVLAQGAPPVSTAESVVLPIGPVHAVSVETVGVPMGRRPSR